MTDPISRLNVNDAANACIDGDGEASTSSAPPAVAPPPASAPVRAPSPPPTSVPVLPTRLPPTSVPALVAAFAPSTVVQYDVTTEGPVPGANSYRISHVQYSEQVSSGVLQGTGVETGKVTVTAGADKNLQFSGREETLSVTKGGYHLSIVNDVASGRLNKGEHNDDGSIGGNLGASGDLVGTEATLDTPYGSVTYGSSVSFGASGSMGVRDADHDGKPEFCAKMSIPAYTIGACIEQPW